MNYFSGSSSASPDLFKSLFTFKDVSDKTQQHLTRVYTLLLACAAFCALGMYANATFIASGFLMNLVSILVSFYLIFQI